MNADIKIIRNPQSLWIMRSVFWVGVLFAIPLALLNIHNTGPALVGELAAALTLLVQCYLAVAIYILAYRPDNPPTWARWVLPKKWIDEWRQIVHADPGSIWLNRNRLVRVSAGAVFFAILLLLFLSGKI
jgi:hypothetical protein